LGSGVGLAVLPSWWEAHEADVAYEGFTAAWDGWQIGHGTSAGLDDLEAGA
jgi:hypothetical protein